MINDEYNVTWFVHFVFYQYCGLVTMELDRGKVPLTSKQTSNQNSERLDFDAGDGGKPEASKDTEAEMDELEDGEIVSDSDDIEEVNQTVNAEKGNVDSSKNNIPTLHKSSASVKEKRHSHDKSRKSDGYDRQFEKGSDQLSRERKSADSSHRGTRKRSNERKVRKEISDNRDSYGERRKEEMRKLEDKLHDRKNAAREMKESRPSMEPKIQISNKSGPDNMLSLDLITKARKQGVKTIHVPVQMPHERRQKQEEKHNRVQDGAKREHSSEEEIETSGDVTKELEVKTTLKSLIPEKLLQAFSKSNEKEKCQLHDDEKLADRVSLENNTEALNMLKMKAMRHRQKTKIVKPEIVIVTPEGLKEAQERKQEKRMKEKKLQNKMMKKKEEIEMQENKLETKLYEKGLSGAYDRSEKLSDNVGTIHKKGPIGEDREKTDQKVVDAGEIDNSDSALVEKENAEDEVLPPLPSESLPPLPSEPEEEETNFLASPDDEYKGVEMPDRDISDLVIDMEDEAVILLTSGANKSKEIEDRRENEEDKSESTDKSEKADDGKENEFKSRDKENNARDSSNSEPSSQNEPLLKDFDLLTSDMSSKNYDTFTSESFGELYSAEESDGGMERGGFYGSDMEENDLYSIIFNESAGILGTSETMEDREMPDEKSSKVVDTDLDSTLVDEENMTSSTPQKRKRSRSNENSSCEESKEVNTVDGDSEVPPQKKPRKGEEMIEKSSKRNAKGRNNSPSEISDVSGNSEQNAVSSNVREFDVVDDLRDDECELSSEEEMLDDSELHAMLEEGVDRQPEPEDDEEEDAEPVYSHKIVLDGK